MLSGLRYVKVDRTEGTLKAMVSSLLPTYTTNLANPLYFLFTVSYFSLAVEC